MHVVPARFIFRAQVRPLNPEDVLRAASLRLGRCDLPLRHTSREKLLYVLQPFWSVVYVVRIEISDPSHPLYGR